jgi:hypothetical protein
MNFEKGIFVICLDTELAWGTQGKPRYEHAYRNTRAVIEEMLNILGRYQLSATWAVVGKLFLDKTEENDIWHVPDAVRRIMACPVPQEIGCHSFAHTLYESSCDADCVHQDLAQCRALARTWDLKMESFVYPRNVVKYAEQLSSHGFRIFRDRDNTWYNRLPGVLRRAGHALDAYCWPYAPVGTLTRTHGVLAVPGNQFFTHRMGWARWLPVSFQVRKACHGLEHAARQRKIFHLWTHPFNVATDPRNLLEGFRKICEHAARLREKDILENMTMGQLAHRYG